MDSPASETETSRLCRGVGEAGTNNRRKEKNYQPNLERQGDENKENNLKQ
jgi:hypothetical protein